MSFPLLISMEREPRGEVRYGRRTFVTRRNDPLCRCVTHLFAYWVISAVLYGWCYGGATDVYRPVPYVCAGDMKHVRKTVGAGIARACVPGGDGRGAARRAGATAPAGGAGSAGWARSSPPAGRQRT